MVAVACVGLDGAATAAAPDDDDEGVDCREARPGALEEEEEAEGVEGLRGVAGGATGPEPDVFMGRFRGGRGAIVDGQSGRPS